MASRSWRWSTPTRRRSASSVVIGIITTPPSATQEAAETLVTAGVQSILNFAPTVLDVPPHVLVREVDVAVELQILAFHEERRSGGQAVANVMAALETGVARFDTSIAGLGG